MDKTGFMQRIAPVSSFPVLAEKEMNEDIL
jgi:hypothetical protein